MKCKYSVRGNLSVVTCEAARGKWQGLGKSVPWGTLCVPWAVAVLHTGRSVSHLVPEGTGLIPMWGCISGISAVTANQARLVQKMSLITFSDSYKLVR